MAAVSKVISMVFIKMILAYRIIVRPFIGISCRFEPSCSSYAMEVITTHGVLRGVYLVVKRLLRCHPWHSGGIDPAPPFQCHNTAIPLCHHKKVLK